MSAVWIKETHVNETEGYLLGEPVIYETWAETPGELYKGQGWRGSLPAEYGRCTSKVYIDTEEGTKAIGWTFLKRDKYEDTGESFLHRTWISVVDGPAEVTRKINYVSLD
jgi:hypothetical protein